MAHIFFNFFSFIITVGLLITIHELGHFITAKYYGVIIEKFSIGFGYTLWKKYDKSGTEYIIASIPLGGYVKMLDEKKNLAKTIPKNRQYFQKKKIWKRIIIIASGSIFNFLFSIFIYWMIFLIGITHYKPIIEKVIPNSTADHIGITSGMEIQYINNQKTLNWDSVYSELINTKNKENITICTTYLDKNNDTKTKKFFLHKNYIKDKKDPISSLGIIPIHQKIVPILTKIEQNSAAMKSGFKPKDKIISVNDVEIKEWKTLTDEIQNNPNTKLKITVERKGIPINLILCPESKTIYENKKIGFAGIYPTIIPIPKEYKATYSFRPISSLIHAGNETWKVMRLIFENLIKLFYNQDFILKNLGGPISIAHNAGTAIKSGLIHYLIFLSIISINLGIINLLPLPILDGGYLVFLIIESFIKKPISQKIKNTSYQISLILLITLTGIALFNDFSKFIK
ncbi:MAG: intramembrane zinc metalloprotease [Candidatus Westeberhardia cardiocondylae]|nr:intramembrane zinc metalloprotease [Candidatus Westeberhardia cardiocondylae]